MKNLTAYACSILGPIGPVLDLEIIQHKLIKNKDERAKAEKNTEQKIRALSQNHPERCVDLDEKDIGLCGEKKDDL